MIAKQLVVTLFTTPEKLREFADEIQASFDKAKLGEAFATVVLAEDHELKINLVPDQEKCKKSSR